MLGRKGRTGKCGQASREGLGDSFGSHPSSISGRATSARHTIKSHAILFMPNCRHGSCWSLPAYQPNTLTRETTLKQTLLQEKYPIFVAEIDKNETRCTSVDDIVTCLKDKIAGNPKVQFIGIFDHYAHTTRIQGEINPDIKVVVDVIFCFGLALPNPQVLAVRPLSIGVADMGDKFVVSFMEAPMKSANQAMEACVKGLRNGV